MSGPARSRLIEVDGVAGAGKSSLVGALCSDGSTFRRGEFVHARRPRHLALILRTIPRLMPILVRDLWRGPRLDWADVKLLAYVAGWHPLLRRGSSPDQVTLLEPGPIYALVRVTAKGARVTRTARFVRWRDEMLDAWAERLEAIVWLDAPDPVLWHRINDRPQRHGTKGEREEVGLAFIELYRRLFGASLDRIRARGGPRILRFDTAEIPSEEVAARVRQTIQMVEVGS